MQQLSARRRVTQLGMRITDPSLDVPASRYTTAILTGGNSMTDQLGGDETGDDLNGEKPTERDEDTERDERDMTLPSKISFDLSSLLPNFAEIIRPHLPDLSRVVRDAFPSDLMPKIDIPQQIYPALDVSAMMKIDTSALTRLAPTLDLSSIIPKIVLPDLTGLNDVITRLLEKLPPNWPRDPDLDLNHVFAVIQDEGVPLVWVPRVDIVKDVLAAPDRDARVKILLGRSSDVMQDCRDTLSTINHPDLSNQLPLANKVIDAFENGHAEAAQALAVVVTETVVSRTIDKSYKKVRDLVKVEDPDDLAMGELRIKAALAPIGPFYVSWYPSMGSPAPTELSRHVTVHQADFEHYTSGNAIIAVMLVTSVLRAVQEFLELP
ncbi:hypothetical protein [Micromonospora aurantiaca (nom. illeg.)]|uniref:hypothetical protein n=1 Tax=Micromonospora aurantiaca (nom. illeg.) TaxID=47850 RepID=UPI00223ABBD2|nr:hypothetical protein [Micromonospora aurantiaca]